MAASLKETLQPARERINDAEARARRAAERERQARLEAKDARRGFLQQVLEARRSGATYREIGDALGVTPQRALSIVRRAEQELCVKIQRNRAEKA